MSKRIFKLAKAKMLEHLPYQDGLTSFVILNKLGEDKCYYVESGPCYAALERNNADNANCFGIFAMTNHSYEGKDPRDYRPQAIVYLHWLLNESPYARNFDTKCPIEALEEGVLVNTKHPTQEMQAALISYRQLWEYDHICKVTADLYYQGVEGLVAYIMGHMFEPRKIGTYMPTGFQDSHNALSSWCLGPTYYQNALALKSQYKRNYKKNKNYAGVNKCFGEDGDFLDLKDKVLKKHLKHRDTRWGGFVYDEEPTLKKLVAIAKDLEKELSK